MKIAWANTQPNTNHALGAYRGDTLVLAGKQRNMQTFIHSLIKHSPSPPLPRPLSDLFFLLNLLQSHWPPLSPSTHAALPHHRAFAQPFPSVWNDSSLNCRSQTALPP